MSVFLSETCPDFESPGEDSENSTISRVTNQANSSSLEGFLRMWTDVNQVCTADQASFGDFKMYHS